MPDGGITEKLRELGFVISDRFELQFRAPETDLFGAQSPTSPLLPPRKVPLEDESPSLAPEFNVFVLGRDLIVGL
ncbi:hypothetical protein F511_16539 [Dorcoceras hygrometricum]|uniref:Uncharacterized protein n=1 Tax=Dorcoceras hygrometricum TaxID=472368 RepID=A0A2Z7C271_9LAMI|nr:hypothetical protein F511_16539 [Dorcoceras hygrometricum]